MILSYEEALDRCLEAARQGRDLDEVIAGLPERYSERLRRDAALAGLIRDQSAVIPSPSAEAQRTASARLGSELSRLRVQRAAPSAARSALGLPRFALVGLALAVLLIGASFAIFPSGGGDGGVEAATVEGVVVASGQGSLTVQTLDSLEEVSIPLDAEITDDTGVKLNPASIEVGQVVLVQGKRPQGGAVSAVNVKRLLNGIPGWCSDAPARCRQIAQNLQQAQARCRDNPRGCPVLQDRIDLVIDEAAGIAALEELKQRCRETGAESCQELIAFCREHTPRCIATDPGPVIDRLEEARERLQSLQRLCAQRDTSACREVAQICASHPVLCPPQPLRPLEIRPADQPATPRPAPTATPAPQRPASSPTPFSDRRPAR